MAEAGQAIPREQGNPRDGILALDSVTQIPAGVPPGRVAICASHGGVYAAWYAARRGIAAIILHDAGIGREAAGIAGLDWLDGIGVPGAAVGHLSARIGSVASMRAEGVLSTVNRAAAALGLRPGMGCEAAAALLLRAAPPAPPAVAEMAEARREVPGAGHRGVRVVTLDSNGLVAPGDAGHVVVTGSHGGLLGDRPESAVKAQVFAAIYNDAGGGRDGAGFSRLPALEARGIPAATVSAFSARIGEGWSSWEDGFVSALNPAAAARGGAIGQSCRDLVAVLLHHP